jgi:pimeloyl-ACP methyl ester carboxylesterase
MLPLVLGLLAIGLSAGYLLVVYDNGYGGFAHRPPLLRPDEARDEGSLETVWFPAVDGTRLEGWLLLPRVTPAPLVVMAPGLTGTKDAYLEPFAWRFVAAGLAVLLFDYRTFGGSEGTPRHWVDPLRHAEDYGSAIDFARRTLAATGRIDATRLALWGSSFSGGTALVVAATRPADVRAVVAQAPYLATPESQQPDPWSLARYVVWTFLDLVRDRLGQAIGLRLAPVYVPAFGRPGELALARSAENPSVHHPDHPEAAEFWRRMPPIRGGWENKLLARVFATLGAVTPLDHVAAIRCPVHLVGAEADDLVPRTMIADAFARLPSGDHQLTTYPCRHFDLYLDDVLEQNARVQARFLARHLGAGAAEAAAPLPRERREA